MPPGKKFSFIDFRKNPEVQRLPDSVFGGQNYWQCQNKNFFKKVKLSFGQGS